MFSEDDDFEAAAREALRLATADSEPQLSRPLRRSPSQECPVAQAAVSEAMD